MVATPPPEPTPGLSVKLTKPLILEINCDTEKQILVMANVDKLELELGPKGDLTQR